METNLVNQEYLADIATNIWATGAKKRKFKLWLNELNRMLKGIDRNLSYQEDDLIKGIKRGFVDQEVIIESNSKIEDYRAEMIPWLKQMTAWAENDELVIEEKMFNAIPADEPVTTGDLTGQLIEAKGFKK
jgi:hypothetical protein